MKLLYKAIPLTRAAWRISNALVVGRRYEKYGICVLFQGYNPKTKVVILYLGRPDPEMGLEKFPIQITNEVKSFSFMLIVLP